MIGAGRPEPDEPRVTAPETDHPPTRTGRRRAAGSASASAESQQSASGSVPVRTGGGVVVGATGLVSGAHGRPVEVTEERGNEVQGGVYLGLGPTEQGGVEVGIAHSDDGLAERGGG